MIYKGGIYTCILYFFFLYIAVNYGSGSGPFRSWVSFFLPYDSKSIIQALINIIIISENLEHMFYSMKMVNRSPFRCPKVLFGPFRWLKSFSVFSRTGQRPQRQNDDNSALYFGTGELIMKTLKTHNQQIFDVMTWPWFNTDHTEKDKLC